MTDFLICGHDIGQLYRWQLSHVRFLKVDIQQPTSERSQMEKAASACASRPSVLPLTADASEEKLELDTLSYFEEHSRRFTLSMSSAPAGSCDQMGSRKRVMHVPLSLLRFEWPENSP